MQLLILLFLLAYGGKTDKLKEVQPLLESIGGDEMKSALKDAEELGNVLSAVQSIAKGDGMPNDIMDAFDVGDNFNPPQSREEQCGKEQSGKEQGFPLAPIANIADEGITYCLSRYIAADI